MSRVRAKYHNDIPPKVPPYVHCHSLMADVIFRFFSIVHLSTYVVVSSVYHCGFAPVIHQRPDWAGACAVLRGWGHQRLLFLCDVKAPYFPGDEGHHVVIFRPHPTHAIMNSLHTTCLAILRLLVVYATHPNHTPYHTHS